MCVVAGVFARTRPPKCRFFPPKPASFGQTLPGGGGGFRQSAGGVAGAGGMAGALQSGQAAAAEHSAPARARGERVFAIISIITTS